MVGIIKFIEKNPELLSKIGKSKISIRDTENTGTFLIGSDLMVIGKYEPETDTITLPEDVFSHKGTPQRMLRKSFGKLKFPILQHELEHKKQKEEGRLPPKDMSEIFKHQKDPREKEARKASRQIPERKRKVREEIINKAFREIIK